MNSKQKKNFIRVISFLSVACIVLTVSTVTYASKAKKYEFLSEISSQRAMNELCEALDNITVSLQKGVYAGTSEKLLDIGNDLTQQASCAKICLGQITDENMITDEIYKFLSQIGAFTLSLTKGNETLTLTSTDSENLRKLLQYSQSLSDGLTQVRDGYFDGSVSMQKTQNTLNLENVEMPQDFSSSMTDVEQNLADYPTLIYDGPFADNVLNKKGGTMLSSLNEITKDEAKEKAARIIGTSSASLREESEENSNIPLYCFSKGDISIGITKKGGLVCYMLNPAEAGEETISSDEAVKRAKKYLDELGYDYLTESYYSVYDGVCTINFAYQNEGIIHYSDLIKVSVALDSGKITALDARGYLMNHSKRDIYEENITEEQARNSLSPLLSVISVKSAVIPLETGKEAYCYEFRCKDNSGQEVLVYIDKQTGKEQDILLLLYSDGGVLTR